MNDYIATFHTHADAIVAHRSLTGLGCVARMMPVPRKLSSSCGTCVRYQAQTPMEGRMKAEYEAVYQVTGKDYTRLFTGTQ